MSIDQYLEMSEPIYWKQGLLLSPQHFQQQQLHMDRLTTHKLFISQPNYWGLIDIDINLENLNLGTVSISRLHAVLPDGEVINFSQDEAGVSLEGQVKREQSQESLEDQQTPGAEEAEQAVDEETSDNEVVRLLEGNVNEIEALKPDDDGLIEVCIGVVRRGVNGKSSGNGQHQRYEMVVREDVMDENAPDQKIDVVKQKLIPKVFVTNDVPSTFITLPLLKLRKRQDGEFEISNYHPPMLDIQVSRKLFGDNSVWSQVDDLVSDMRKKAANLIAAQSGQLSDRSTIGGLIGRLPAIEVLLKTKMTHPYQLYTAFVEVVAGFMTLEYAGDFFVPRGYEHDDPAPGFTEHLERLKEQVSAIQLAFESIPFRDTVDGTFELELPENVGIEDVVIAVLPKKNQGPMDIKSWMGSCLAGTDSAHARFRKQRVLGANRREMPGQERIAKRLPVNGHIYVLSNKDYGLQGKRYRSIEKGKVLRIQGKSESAPAAVFLYIQQAEK